MSRDFFVLQYTEGDNFFRFIFMDDLSLKKNIVEKHYGIYLNVTENIIKIKRGGPNIRNNRARNAATG